MAMTNRELGAWGERAAAGYLEKKGYVISAVNYRTRLGEIDIICERGGFVAFIEVKLRKSRGYAHAREYVTAAKQRKIRSAALSWLQDNASSKQPRFDVIEIYAPLGENTQRLEIVHIENAF